MEQKLVENAKIEKLKCDILGDFQTLWTRMVCKNKSFNLRTTLIRISMGEMRLFVIIFKHCV